MSEQNIKSLEEPEVKILEEPGATAPSPPNPASDHNFTAMINKRTESKDSFSLAQFEVDNLGRITSRQEYGSDWATATQKADNLFYYDSLYSNGYGSLRSNASGSMQTGGNIGLYIHTPGADVFTGEILLRRMRSEASSLFGTKNLAVLEYVKGSDFRALLNIHGGIDLDETALFSSAFNISFSGKLEYNDTTHRWEDNRTWGLHWTEYTVKFRQGFLVKVTETNKSASGLKPIKVKFGLGAPNATTAAITSIGYAIQKLNWNGAKLKFEAGWYVGQVTDDTGKITGVISAESEKHK